MKKYLYNTHLECAKTWNYIWYYMQIWVNQELNISMDNLYLKLDKKKLDNLQEQNRKHERERNNNT
jgi:hypothetical protein